MEKLHEKPIEEGRETERQIGMVLEFGNPDIVIHGKNFDEKGLAELKEVTHGIDTDLEKLLIPESDFDGKMVTYLLNMAGIKYDSLTYVKPGESIKGSVNIDTGEKSIEIEKDGTIFIDHHAKEKGQAHSAASILYKILLEANLLKESPWLNNLIKFTNEIDDEAYEFNKDFSFQDDWSKSFYGLYRKLDFETVVEYFKTKGENFDPKKPFDEEEINNGLIKTSDGKEKSIKKLCEEQQNFVKKNIKEVIDVERQQLRDKATNFSEGKILINRINPADKFKKLGLGFTAARAMGYKTYISLTEDDGTFFISSQNADYLAKLFKKASEKFSSAKLIRGNMIIQNNPSEKINWEDFLKTLDLERK